MSRQGPAAPSELDVRLSHRGADLEVYSLTGEISLPTMPTLRHLVRDLETRQVTHALLDLTHLAGVCVEGAHELAYASIHARAMSRSLDLIVVDHRSRTMLSGSAPLDRLIIHGSLADAMKPTTDLPPLPEPRRAEVPVGSRPPRGVWQVATHRAHRPGGITRG